MSAIPNSARWLGLLGLLPFLGLTAMHVLEMETDLLAPGLALRAYGAVILSFIGGIQWGLGIRLSDGNARSRQGLSGMLVMSVIPSLIAWAGLLAPETLGFGLLIAGFGLVLAVDMRAVRAGMAPSWYPRLRYPLTAVVISTLAVSTVFGA